MHLIKIILSSLLLSVFINNVSANEIIVPKETQDVLQIFMIVNPDMMTQWSCSLGMSFFLLRILLLR